MHTTHNGYSEYAMGHTMAVKDQFSAAASTSVLVVTLPTNDTPSSPSPPLTPDNRDKFDTESAELYDTHRIWGDRGNSRSGSRTDLYGVRETGVRHNTGRGRDGYMNMLHTKQRVFRPHVTLIHDDTHLASPNDGVGRDCPAMCGEMQWQCGGNQCNCIGVDQRCDKIAQCEDGSDEYDCELIEDMMSKLQRECERTGYHILCPRTYRCINKDWLCDGDDDCGDYSDESHCGEAINCTDYQFTCTNGFCIPKLWLCDGENDCRDYSDESHCNRTRYSCVNLTKNCLIFYVFSLN